jgi:hypothetical protein
VTDGKSENLNVRTDGLRQEPYPENKKENITNKQTNKQEQTHKKLWELIHLEGI